MITISKPKQPTNEDSDENPTVSAFPITRSDEIEGTSETLDFVEGLLTEGGASVVYGPSNCGKSFWSFELAACIATGRDFRDEMEVEQGAVVYVALEGKDGTRNRVEAMRREKRLPDGSPFYLCFSPVSLLESGHSKQLAESVKTAADQSELPCRLVVIDTLARAMAGGDENGGKDMTRAVESMDAVRAATGAHVMLVHHCGKDEAKGARGHSSLRAAVDTEIELFRPEGEKITTVRVTKQRDLELGEAMPFSLHVVELGVNRRGKLITSCIVHHEDSMMAVSKAKAGRKQEVDLKRLMDLLPQPSTTAWQKLADAEMGVSKSTFYRCLEPMRKSHGAKQDAKGFWDR